MSQKELVILGIPRSWLNIPFGVPQLDALGLLDPAVLPPLAISQVFVESSEAAMLALTAQVGDVCKRTDLQPNQSFMLKLEPATVLANWIQISDIAIDFTTLLDTPNNYTGQADKWVKVNSTPNGLEFITHDKALHDALNIDADTLDGADTGLDDADVLILPAASDGDFLQRGASAWAAQAHDKALHDALNINGTVDVSCSAFRNAVQSITQNAWVAVQLNDEDYDTDTMHDPVTDNTKIVIPTTKGGKYCVGAMGTFAGDTNNMRAIAIQKNGAPGVGTTLIQQNFNPIGSEEVGEEISKTVDLAGDDEIEVYVYQSTSAALNIVAGADKTFLQVVKQRGGE